MMTTQSLMDTKAFFSDNKSKRYLLTKTWDKEKKSLAIIMLRPSTAADVYLDSTTMLVINNCFRLDYGSVSILNLFADLDGKTLSCLEREDDENINIILDTIKSVDTIVYAAGVGKSNDKLFRERQKKVLLAIKPFEDKLYCLCDKFRSSRLQHPLSPAVRNWNLSKLEISELLDKESVDSNIEIYNKEKTAKKNKPYCKK